MPIEQDTNPSLQDRYKDSCEKRYVQLAKEEVAEGLLLRFVAGLSVQPDWSSWQRIRLTDLILQITLI